MNTKQINLTKLEELTAGFAGQIVQPGEPDYEEARRVHNGLIDKRPAMVARCRGAADIVDAVNFARQEGLEVAVRGGGHNVAGLGTVDGGIVIDLSSMSSVHVDPSARTALAEGGATWNKFNRETQLHGLATTGGVVSSTGIGGLTLGGGLGWLMGEHGLALDNLLSVNVVLADGRIVQASAEENADLFWALRGGGGNFGVAASLEYRLHEIGPVITGGLIAYPFDSAWDVLRHYRDLTASLPDEFTIFAGLVHAPDGSGTKLVAIVLCHAGPLAAGEAAVAPIKAFGTPAIDAIGPMPYTAVNAMLDEGYPRGALNHWKSRFLANLDDELLRVMIECFEACPTPMGQLLIEHFHGAVTRIGVSDTAFPHRAPSYNMLILSEWMELGDTERCVAWARNTYAAVEPFVSANRYVNYMDTDETNDAVAAAYGPNLKRLQAVKAKYDPENFFHVNQNIAPAIGR